MRITAFAISFLLMIFCGQQAQALNPSLTYQGRIVKSNGEPLEAGNVQFRIQIRTPTAASCVIYEEMKNLSMTGSHGAFSLTINDGSGTRMDSSGLDLDEVLSNRSTFNFAPADCSGSTYTFTPTADSGRKFRVLFNDGSGWSTIPDMDIAMAPFAVEAMQIGGYKPENFVRVVNGSGVPQSLSPLSPVQYTEFLALLGGTSTQYQRAGQFMGGTLPMGTMAHGYALRMGSSGAWESYDPGAGGGGSGSVTSVVAGAGLAGGNIVSAGTISLATLGTAAVGYKISYDEYGRVTASAAIDEADIPTITTAGKVSGNSITSGTIGGTTSVNTSGTVAANQISTRGVHISNMEPKTISILAPSSITPVGGYTLTLPVDTGTAGQFLSTNGSGLLSWTSVAAGSSGIASVSGTAPISVTGTSSLVVSVGDASDSAKGVVQLATSGGTLAGYAVQANDPRLSDARTTSGTAGGDLTGSYPVPVVAAIRSIAVDATAPTSAGQVLRYNGTTQYAPAFLSLADVRSTIGPGFTQTFPSTSCTAKQTLTWSSITDTLTCSNIALTSADITGSVVNGGQAGAVTVGTDDLTTLTLETNNTARVTIGTTGNFGIGTASPNYLLDVNGTVSLGGATNINSTLTMTGSSGTVRRTGTTGVLSLLGGGTSGTDSGVFLYGSGHGSKPNNIEIDGANQSFRSVDGSTTKMIITSSGSVGIGTTSPASLLHVTATDTSTTNGSNPATLTLTTTLNPSGTSLARHSGLYNIVTSGGTSTYSSSQSGVFNQINYTASSGSQNLYGDFNTAQVNSGSGGSYRIYGSYNRALNVGTVAAGQMKGAYNYSEVNNASVPGVSSVIMGAHNETKFSATGGTFLYGFGSKNELTFDSASRALTYGIGSQNVLTVTSGTITSAYGSHNTLSNSGTVTNWYGLYVDGVTGTAPTNSYGIYVNDAVSRNYLAGSLGIGTNSPTQLLDVNGPIRVRPATLPGTPASGVVAIDSGDSNNLKYYDGTGWRILGVTGGAGGGSGSSTTSMTFNSNSDNIGTDGGFNFQVNGSNIFTLGNNGLATFSSSVMAGQLNTRSGNQSLTVTNAVATDTLESVSEFRRERQDATAPGAGFAGQLSFSLEGSANGVFPVTNSLSWGWENAQTNATTDRDSYMSFSTMLDNTLAERMRITSSGSVGIGTNNPSFMLDVNSSSVAINAVRNTANVGSVQPTTIFRAISSGTIVDGFGPSIAFNGKGSATANYTYAEIGGVRNGADNSGAFVIRTNLAGTMNETMRVTSSGSVGIGTAAPSAALDVVGAIKGSTTMALGSSGTNGTLNLVNSAGTTAGWVSGYSGEFQLGASAGFMSFITNNGTPTEKMRITSAGNVGIGTTAPGAPLTVAATSSSSDRGISVSYSGNDINGTILRSYKSRGSAAVPVQNGDELMRYSSNASDGTTYVETAKIATYANGVVSTGIVPTDMRFMTMDSSGSLGLRMAIMPSGAVGIGTMSPSAALQVNGQGAANTGLAIATFNNSGGSPRLWISDESTAGSTPPTLRTSASLGLGVASYNGPLILYAGNSAGFDVERVRITSTGSVGIGTTNPTERLDLGGGNIKMGYEIVTTNVAANSAVGWYYANCPAGKYATGGSCASGSGQVPTNTDISTAGFGCYVSTGNTTTNYVVKAVCMNVR